MNIRSRLARALLATLIVGVAPAALAQTNPHVKDLVFVNANHPPIKIDMTQPIIYKSDGSVIATCIPVAGTQSCIPSTDPRAPTASLTSNLAFVSGSQEIYHATSGQAFWVYRNVSNSPEVCVATVEGAGSAPAWSGILPTSGTATSVTITVNVPTGQSADVTLAIQCFNQYGGPQQPFRRVFRTFR